MRMLARPALLAAAALATIGLVAGCSGSSTDSGAASPTANPVGSGLVAPVIVEPGQTEATTVVGGPMSWRSPRPSRRAMPSSIRVPRQLPRALPR